jgi:hypothetical protein
MSQVVLNQILDQLQSLESSELKQLNRAIQNYLANQEKTTKQAAFHQVLIASGLVRQIKQATYEHRTSQQLIQIQGEPIS